MDSFKWAMNQKIWKLLLLIATFVGVICYVYSQFETVERARNVPQVFITWFEQLPKEHWLHKKEYQELLQLLKLKTEMEQTAKLAIKMTTDNVGQSGKFGQLAAEIANQEMKYQESKYRLEDSNNNVIKKIYLDVGNSTVFSFYRDRQKLNFDIEEKDFYAADFLDKLAMVYVEDNKIASMYNGVITAKVTGKTNLVICIDGKLFRYPVLIK